MQTMARLPPTHCNGGMRALEPQRFDFEHSRLQRTFVALSHAATAILCLVMPLPPGCAPFAVLLVTALALRAWWRLPPAALIVRLDATLTVLQRNGVAVDAMLLNGGYVGARLVVIEWRETARQLRQTLVVTSDMLDAGAFRRLRVHLRYATSGDDQGSSASHERASMSAPLSALGCPPTR
jgi:hypothetical protein